MKYSELHKRFIRSGWIFDHAVGSHYFYTKDDVGRVRDAIADGCGTDAPGSLVAWMCRHTTMHSMEMPGSRYDIGNLESYEKAQKSYHGIIRSEAGPSV